MSERLTLQEALADFLLYKRASKRAPRTIQYYKEALSPFVAKGGLSSSEIRQYLANLPGSSATVANRARAIRAFAKFCHREGWIDEPVSFEMPKVTPAPKRALTRDEGKALLNACKTLRDKALVSLLLDTGLRSGEVTRLTWGNLDLSSGTLRVPGGKTGPRLVLCGAQTRRVLLKYRRRVAHEPSDPLFSLTGSGILQAIRRAAKRAGFRCTVHDLRRTFATWSLEAGVDLATLQRLMGHSQVTTTMEYLVWSDGLLARRYVSPVDGL